MQGATGFKTRPSRYSIGFAPTSRARCRTCKGVIEKGDIRIVTHAFVRPGRTHDFVCHERCAGVRMVQAILGVYGTVGRVPMASGMDAETCIAVRARLERMNSLGDTSGE